MANHQLKQRQKKLYGKVAMNRGSRGLQVQPQRQRAGVRPGKKSVASVDVYCWSKSLQKYVKC